MLVGILVPIIWLILGGGGKSLGSGWKLGCDGCPNIWLSLGGGGRSFVIIGWEVGW